MNVQKLENSSRTLSPISQWNSAVGNLGNFHMSYIYRQLSVSPLCEFLVFFSLLDCMKYHFYKQIGSRKGKRARHDVLTHSTCARWLSCDCSSLSFRLLELMPFPATEECLKQFWCSRQQRAHGITIPFNIRRNAAAAANYACSQVISSDTHVDSLSFSIKAKFGHNEK